MTRRHFQSSVEVANAEQSGKIWRLAVVLREICSKNIFVASPTIGIDRASSCAVGRTWPRSKNSARTVASAVFGLVSIDPSTGEYMRLSCERSG